MMNCEDFLQTLDEFGHARVPDIEQARMSRHLATCEACRRAHAAAATLDLGLSRLADSTPPPGASQRVVDRAVAQAERQSARSARLRMGGIAAALLLCAIVIGYVPDRPSGDINQATVTLDRKVKMVSLAFDSTHSVAEARLTITLSDNLGIEGYGNRRTLSWNTSLQAGVNRLSLPVYAIAEGEGEIAASLEIGQQQKRFVVKTRNPGAQRRAVDPPAATA